MSRDSFSMIAKWLGIFLVSLWIIDRYPQLESAFVALAVSYSLISQLKLREYQTDLEGGAAKIRNIQQMLDSSNAELARISSYILQMDEKVNGSENKVANLDPSQWQDNIQ